MNESKKLALLRILDILKKHTDINHPLTQEDIAKYLENDYGIIIERKAIGRNISLLKEAGYAIETNHLGNYLEERDFEDSELRVLIDGVLCSKYINATYSKDLIYKLCSLANKYFQAHVKNIYSVNEWNKTESKSLFYNIEQIDEAIEKELQIKFDYNKYGIDKKLHFTKSHTVSPYQLIVHNQHYYLMALHEYYQNIVHYRVDHITNISLTDNKLTDIHNIKGYEQGINYEELSTSYPYLFTDDLQTIVFGAKKAIIDDIVEWFGTNVQMEENEDTIKVTVKASPNAMKYWAMQYLNSVEIISPLTLREQIKKDLLKGIDKYKN